MECNLVSFVGQDDSDILPAFFDHYRALGISAFHVFVHGDWTSAELAPLLSDDVTIAGMVQGPFDIALKSSTLQAYLKRFEGEWIVIADADEFLELPYRSLPKTVRALACLGLGELPATLLQRASCDGRLLQLSHDRPPHVLFSCYDFLLAERMGVLRPVWKRKYPLVKIGPEFRLSRGHHLPHTGRPSSHVPVRAVVHHFKWRDRLRRSVLRSRGAQSNQGEQESYQRWLEQHEGRVPTSGLREYSRAALFAEGHLVRPSRNELMLHGALRKARSSPQGRQAQKNLRRLIRSIPDSIARTEHRSAEYVNRDWLLTPPGRIAIVTTDLLGLRRTGGLGTAMSALAEQLSAAGHEVHVFLVPYADFPSLGDAWVEFWKARGVQIHYYPRKNRNSRAPEVSLAVAELLAAGDWDVVHFPDAGGLAAAPLLLRAAGLAFRSCRIAVTMHGPTQWHRGGNFLPWTVAEGLNRDLESTSVRLADVVICPSDYMVDWSRKHFGSGGPHIVIPNALTGESRHFHRSCAEKMRINRVAFFGRIEPRKGIDTFVSAIDMVLASGRSDFEVLFLGSVGDPIAALAAKTKAEDWPCKTTFIHNYTSHEALALLRDGYLAVIPTALDNSPYTVYECLESGIPFLASDIGGIPELVHEDDRRRVLAPEGAGSFAERILAALREGFAPARPSFDPVHADVDLLALHGGLVHAARASRGRIGPRTEHVTAIVHGPPRERPDHLTAQVLRHWSNEGVEVLSGGYRGSDPLNTDASPQPSAAMHTGTINGLARSAVGDYLMFCHASVVPLAESLATMLAACRSTGADAVLCGHGASEDGRHDVPVLGVSPGISPEGSLEWPRAILVRKQVFLDAGGFTEDAAMADIIELELANRLRAAGRLVVAVPFPVVAVRQARSAPLSDYQRGRLAAPWVAAAPEPLQGIVRKALHRAQSNSQGPSGGARPAPATSAATPPVGTSTTLEPASSRRSEEVSSFLPNAASFWDADSPLNEIDLNLGSANDSGRLRIGADGALVPSPYTHLIHDVEDAEECDFFVADDVSSAPRSPDVRQSLDAVWKRLTGDGNASLPANGFVRLQEVLATQPDFGAAAVELARKSMALSAGFYKLHAPLYPQRVRLMEVRAGSWLPRIDPALSSSGSDLCDFSGLLCLESEFDGGECYFTALDMAVDLKPGRFIASTATRYHEKAVLQVTSGSVLLLSFIMCFDQRGMGSQLARHFAPRQDDGA